MERGGVVWAYMGPPEHMPELPDLEWTRLDESQKFATRHIQECNWLQGVEGGFGASLVEEIYLSPYGTRWVQFYPYNGWSDDNDE